MPITDFILREEQESVLFVDHKLRWEQMHADKAEDKKAIDHQFGIVSFMFTIIDISTDLEQDPMVYTPFNFNEENRFGFMIPNPWKRFMQWASSRAAKRLSAEKIRVHIYQGRDLPSADDTVDADPFVVVHDDCSLADVHDPQNKGRPYNQTIVVPDNLNPPWYQSVELSMEVLKEQKDADDFSFYFLPPFLLDVYDSDANPEHYGKPGKSDFLGRAVVQIIRDPMDPNYTEVSVDDEVAKPLPKWYPIRMSQNLPKCGELLISFTIAKENDYNFRYNVNKTKLYKIVQQED